MADWTDRLRSLDVGGLATIGEGLKQPWDGRIETDVGDGQSDVTPDRGYRSPKLRRRVRDLRTVNKLALKHLSRLPREGESYHYLIGDRHGLWDLIPAFIKRRRRPIERLWVSTLSYGSANAAALLDMLDEGQIGRIYFLVSVMFSAKNRHIFDELIPHLINRGHRAAAMRTHAKILAIDFGEGERYVVESSSNLRTCHCAEQVTIIRDEGLFQFHRRWINRALRTAGTGPKG